MPIFQKPTLKKLLPLVACGLAFCVAITVAGWLFATSSFAVCKIWLPVASKLSGKSLSASEANVSPLHGHFALKGFKASGPGFDLKIDDLSADASPFKAIFGSYEIKSAKVSGAALSVELSSKHGSSSSAPSKSLSPSSIQDFDSKPLRELKLKTGPLKLENCSFRLELPKGEGSALPGIAPWLSVSGLNASCDSLEKGVESHIAVSCAIAGNDCREMALDSSSLSVSASYLPDASFVPQSLSLRCALAVVAAKLESTDLSGSSLDIFCSMKDGGARAIVERLAFEESFKGNPKSSVELSGSIAKNLAGMDFDLKARMRKSPLLDYLIDFAVDCDLSEAELVYDAKFKSEGPRFSSSGAATLKNARFLPHEARASRLGALDLAASHDVSADLQARVLDVKSFDLGASGEGRKLVSISSLRPFSFCWEQGKPLWPRDATPQLSAKIDSLPLSFLNAFSKGVSFSSGYLDFSGLLKAGAASSGKQLSANFKLGARQLALVKADGSPLLEASDFSGEVEAEVLSSGNVSVPSFNIECSRDGVGVASASLSGSYSPKDGSGAIKSAVSILNYKALDLLRLSPDRELRFKSAVKSMQPFELRLETEASLSAKSSDASLKSADLILHSKRYGRISLSLAEPLSVNWGGKELSLSQAKLRAQTSDFDLAIANAFNPESSVKLRGLCNALATASVDLKSGSAALKASASLDCLPVDLPGPEDDHLRISSAIEASLSSWSQVKVSSFNLKTLEPDGETGLEASLSAAYDIKSQKGAADIASFHADGPDLIKLLLMAQAPETARSFVSAISPMDLNVKGSAAFSLPDSTASLNALDAGILGKGGQFISLSCEQPFKACWAKDAKSLQEGQAKFRAGFKGASLVALGSFAPPSKLKFNSGSLNADFSVALAGIWRSVQVEGELSAEGFDAVIAGGRYKGFDPYLNGSVKLDDFGKKLELPSLSFGAKVAKVDRLACLAKGSLDFSSGSPEGKIGVQVSKLDDRFLSQLPFDFVSGIDAFDAAGRFVWSPSPKPEVPSNFLCDAKILRFASSKVKSGGSPIELGGSVAASVDYSPELLAFKQCSLNIASSGKSLANLGVTGQLRSNPSAGPSSVSISSTALDLKSIQALFAPQASPAGAKAAAGQPKASAPQPAQAAYSGGAAQEPGPVDLKGFNGSVSFDLKNVTYGPEVNASFVGRVVSQGGSLSTDGLLLTINGSPVKLAGGINLAKADGYEYSFNTTCQYLDLAPLARAFGSNIKGELRELQFPISGKGVTKANIAAHLNSQLKCKFSKLVVPYQIDAPVVVRIIFFIPFEALSKFDQLIVNNQLDLSPLKRSFEDIKKNDKSIQFQSGEVDLYARNGVVTVSKLYFSNGSPVDSISLTGTEAISSGALDFYSKAHAYRMIVPVRISGTLDKPDIEGLNSSADFLKENTLNILNPENITDGTAGDLTKKALDFGRKLEGLLGR